MLDQAQLMRAIAPKIAAKPRFTLRRLWPPAQWGSAAAAALLIAILAGRSDVGVQRVAEILSSLHLRSPAALRSDQAVAGPFDAETATRQLAQAVRGLAADRDRLITRMAAVEQNLEDMTGSVTRQIEAAKAASAPWPDDQTPVPATAAPMLALAEGLANPLTAATISSPSDAAEAATPAAAYGADIGSATSIKTLHTRWTELRSAHPQLFAGLRPSVTLREGLRSKRTELRLVVGPLPNAEAAAQLCASLAPFRQFCQPTMFDGRLALQ